ncbi:discoidin domain-containing protein [Streptomyces sp. NPDC090442]|uniref:discoidin domain-containing protein n=1 Tax=Streptomyces sp. NPDC090442 TaxID=3365962 RepID=UPI003813435E
MKNSDHSDATAPLIPSSNVSATQGHPSFTVEHVARPTDTTDTDLIVPVEVHALAVNDVVRNRLDAFHRWSPNYRAMILNKQSGEPAPGESLEIVHGSTDDARRFEGIHVQWQLPECLANGFYHESGDKEGETEFALVPNRWLVVRYARVKRNGSWEPLKAAGWVVHSDYLTGDYPEGGPYPPPPAYEEDKDYESTTYYLDPRSDEVTRGSIVPIGRVHPMVRDAHTPWVEPGGDVESFLSAAGPGLPLFAAFASYHMNVFCFQDRLQDLKDEHDPDPPDARLSYFVLGWYAHEGDDILRTAAKIPGLLPPDAESPDDVLAALGWAVEAGVPDTLQHTLYHGTALGITWERRGLEPVTDRPDGDRIRAALGHSSDEALDAASPPSSRPSARLVQALYNGALDSFDDPDRDKDLDEITRRSWFAHSSGGHRWQVVPRPTDTSDSPAVVPADLDLGWLDQLNTDQAAYDEALPLLSQNQWRLWSLYWLKELDPTYFPGKPDGFDSEAEKQIISLTRVVEDQRADIDDFINESDGKIPYGETPEDLQESIGRFLDRLETKLPEELELKRITRQTFDTPADPSIILWSSEPGKPLNRRPLARDHDDPLPCRIPSNLVTAVKAKGNTSDPWTEFPVGSPQAPVPPPGLSGLPDITAPLLEEFALLDLTARPDDAGAPPVLHLLVNNRALVRGPLAEYTDLWRQPWLPMILEWRIRYNAAPYRAEEVDEGGNYPYRWEFRKDEDESEYRYHWTGKGAERGREDPENGIEDSLHFTEFTSRCYLSPSIAYVLRNELSRYMRTYPQASSLGLKALHKDLEEFDGILSQRLDGFNNWLLQHDGTARLTAEQSAPAEITSLLGTDNYTPDPASGTGTRRFRPVRAGHFYFSELRLVDRFGQTATVVFGKESVTQFEPVRAQSVLPEEDLFTDIDGPQRIVQLPPRILQPARLRLETATDPAGATPVAGWLMSNFIDKTLMVYAPDGNVLGELRNITRGINQQETKWFPLPHAPHTHPDPEKDEGFARSYPHLSAFLTPLLNEPLSINGAFDALKDTIDQALATTLDHSTQDDHLPGRLTGRLVALVLADLGIDLAGPPVTDSSWDHVLDAADEYDPYATYEWNIRLGQPDRLTDGLIGFYASTTGPGQDIDYNTLHTTQTTPHLTYLTPIDDGSALRLPARPQHQPLSHHLTLLTDPHAPVHAVTDILPVQSLSLNADLVHQALARIRASFRLVSLLAPTRTTGNLTATTMMDTEETHSILNILNTSLATYYNSHNPPTTDDTVTLDLGDERTITRIDVYLGRPDGTHTWPHISLEHYSDQTTTWHPLTTHTTGDELHHHIPPHTPLTARYLRLRATADEYTEPIAIRAFTATTHPPCHDLVMPQPSAQHGHWTWAEPLPLPQTGWDELPLTPADTQTHPDDPVPTARTGYLQLTPTAPPHNGTTTPHTPTTTSHRKAPR